MPPRPDETPSGARPQGRHDAPTRAPSSAGSSAEMLPPGAGIWDGDTREMTRPRESFIGPYRVEIKVGEGGMGVVYKAWDEKLARHVAIKVLKERLAQNERYLVRLEREARAVASVSHPAVIQVHAFEEAMEGDGAREQLFPNGGLPYVVMEYIDGESIDAALKRGDHFEVADAIPLVLEVARGLSAAFEKGIVHRDIKPSNLLVARDGALKIVDFGLSKDLDGDGTITDEGVVLGTPHYISPEQGQGKRVDHRSDIYSLGATLYHMLTGRPVFDGDSHASIIYAHVHASPLPPHEARAGIPLPVSHVIGKMLAKDPDARYRDYVELVTDLERLASGQALGRETTITGQRTYRAPWWKNRAAFWFVAGLAAWSSLALLIVGIVALLHDPPTESALALAAYNHSSDPRQDDVQIDFVGIARGENSAGELGKFFDFPPAAPRFLENKGLLCNEPGVLTFRYPLERLDGLTIRGLELSGIVDLELSLSDRRGSWIRKLRFAFRGDRKERSTAVGAPVAAWRNAEPIWLDPEPAALPPLRGSCDVSIRFSREGQATRIFLTVTREHSGRTLARLYPESDEDSGHALEGGDWSSGVLEIRAMTPMGRTPISYSMRSLEITGKVNRERISPEAVAVRA